MSHTVLRVQHDRRLVRRIGNLDVTRLVATRKIAHKRTEHCEPLFASSAALTVPSDPSFALADDAIAVGELSAPSSVTASAEDGRPGMGSLSKARGTYLD